MALLHNNVFDAALNVIAACDIVQVRAAGSSVLVAFTPLDSGNFGSITSGSVDGRKIQCLVSDTSDMKNISVSTGGSATKVALIDSATVIAVASLSSTVNLGSSDSVNLSTFSVTFRDPT